MLGNGDGNGDGDGDGRPRDERAQRMLAAVRRKIAEVRAEYGGPRLADEAVVPLPPLTPKPKPWVLRTPDELIAEAQAELAATHAKALELWAKAEESRANAERLRLDVDAAARRRRGEVLLQ
jgi:hypothetical protein